MPNPDSSLTARSLDILRGLPVILFTTDDEGRVDFVNDAAKGLLGRTGRDGAQLLRWTGGDPEEAEIVDVDSTGVAVVFRRRSAVIPGGRVHLLVEVTDAVERWRSLAREAEHRANNLVATIGALARLTSAPTLEAFKAKLDGRIRALSRAHAHLGRGGATTLAAVVDEEFAALCDGRMRASGPAIALSPTVARHLIPALHEMAANARTHGALSVPEGRLAITWRETPDGGFALDWVEDGLKGLGPPRPGFGLGLTRNAVAQELGGELTLDWRETGLHAVIVRLAGG